MERRNTKVVTVVLPENIYTDIKSMAEGVGWPLSRYLRQMIRRYLRAAAAGDERWIIR